MAKLVTRQELIADFDFIPFAHEPVAVFQLLGEHVE